MNPGNVNPMQADRFYQLLNLNRVVRSHRVKFAGLLGLYWLRQRHLWLRFDPVMSCNLRCQMCYFSDPSFTKEITGRFNPAEIERIAEVFFPWALQLYVGCGTEPTTYKGFTAPSRTWPKPSRAWESFTAEAACRWTLPRHRSTRWLNRL